MDLFEHADGIGRGPAPPAPAVPVPQVRGARPGSPFAAGAARHPAFRRAAPAPPPARLPVARPAVAPAHAAASEELRGKVRRVVCRTESGFTVLAIRTGNGSEVSLQTLTAQEFREGDAIIAEGAWGDYRGRPQFRAEVVRADMPRGARGVADWLRGGAVRGIGPAAIAKLAAAFGDRLPDVAGDAAALRKGGLKPAQADALAKTWNANAGMGELEARLRGFGLKPRQAVRVIEEYGAAAIRIIETNPWEMVDIEGIGFPTADRIAGEAGLDMTCSARIQAGMHWAFGEMLAREGHCGMPEPELVSSAAEMLDVGQDVIRHGMDRFADGARILRCGLTGLVFPSALLHAEEVAVDNIAALLARSAGAVAPEDAERAVLRAEAELGVALDRDGGQFAAAVMALSNAVTIITGGPGTGKSTAQAVIVKAHSYFGREDARVQLAAPTGRAAKRLSETSGRQARTIHRLLEFSPGEGGFLYSARNPLRLDVAIIDEISMVDTRLFASLAEALPPDACLTLVGDADQLPSVGPGQVLRDLIDSGLVPVARLTRVHRQAAGSGVAVAAQRINRGEPPEQPGGAMRGFSVTHKADHEVIAAVVKLVRFGLPEAGFDPMRDVQVIAAMRRGDTGVEALNRALKAALNPASDDGNTIRLGVRELTAGDRVMQQRNDYQKGVYNGEVGIVTAVGHDAEPGGTRTGWATADFSGVEARYTAKDAEDIDLAYAATVHKVQGCETPVVVFAAPRGHRRMLNRNLLYTGVTRARMDCRIVGDRQTVDTAPSIADAARRHTGLRERLAFVMENENSPSRTQFR